jgi:serine phosphatase RsbU (regulator of sigma subunit)
MAGIASWLPVVWLNIVYQNTIPKSSNNLTSFHLPPTDALLIDLAYAVFVIVNTFVVARFIRRIEKWDVIDLFWKLLVIGISTLTVTFVFQVINYSLQDDILRFVFAAVYNSVNLYAMLIFLLSGVFIYKKLILYQKNKRKIIMWRAFEVLMCFAFLRIFIDPSWELNLKFFNSIILPAFFIIGLLLSTNVNWSAYLNFQQKLKSLLLILIILVLFVAYFFTLPLNSLIELELYGDSRMLNARTVNDFVSMMTSDFVLVGLLFLFPLLYSLFSMLVIVFNLPTSSVFEQRSSELASIQQINQSIHSNLDIKEIFRTLLSGSLLTSNATAGWIEWIGHEDGDTSRSIPYKEQISQDEITAITQVMDISEKVLGERKPYHIRNLKKHKAHKYSRTKFRSLLAIPVQTREKSMGVLYLLNDLSGSFEEETISSLATFAEQAAIAVENAELVRESITFERYREQLKIAREVQEQILPKKLPSSHEIEFYAMSQEVEEIGGDFYDVVRCGDRQYKVALGDVSGKGTTAAFYMAETKGIFQALAHQPLGVRDFILSANQAISQCFARGSFMTLTYLHIDLEKRSVELLRAGHCPTLHYHAHTDTLTAHELGSMGLGIVRDGKFASFVPEPERIFLGHGDLLILFTDGIVEARNAAREEFGLDALKQIVYEYRKTDSRLIAETLLHRVREYSGGKLEDDYSLLVIKFI